MSNEYKDWLADKIQDTQDIKALCEKFPFLKVADWRTDEVPEDYDYTYTWLDDLEEGWYIAFGIDLCTELAAALEKEGKLETYRIDQIKEKYGELRWYDHGGTRETDEIIEKYTKLSRQICKKCGAPATKISTGWISPWCDECAEKINDKLVSIEEFYNIQEEKEI
jgi:hypothetical protein